MENIRKEWMFHRQLFVFTCFNLSLSYETLKERLDRNRVQQLSSGSILVLPSINAGERRLITWVYTLSQYLLSIPPSRYISLTHKLFTPTPPPLNSTYPSISSLLIWIKGRQGIELHSTLSFYYRSLRLFRSSLHSSRGCGNSFAKIRGNVTLFRKLSTHDMVAEFF